MARPGCRLLPGAAAPMLLRLAMGRRPKARELAVDQRESMSRLENATRRMEAGAGPPGASRVGSGAARSGEDSPRFGARRCKSRPGGQRRRSSSAVDEVSPAPDSTTQSSRLRGIARRAEGMSRGGADHKRPSLHDRLPVTTARRTISGCWPAISTRRSPTWPDKLGQIGEARLLVMASLMIADELSDALRAPGGDHWRGRRGARRRFGRRVRRPRRRRSGSLRRASRGPCRPGRASPR